PVGTGPFKYKSFEPGRESVMERFENYYDPAGKAKADTLTLLDLPDESARYNALLGGQVDLIENVPLAQFEGLKSNSKFVVSSVPTAEWNPIYFRVDLPPFNDVRVRQALRLSIDRQQILDSVFFGQARIGNDVFGRDDPDRDNSLVRHQDIEQAKSLLQQAG